MNAEGFSISSQTKENMSTIGAAQPNHLSVLLEAAAMQMWRSRHALCCSPHGGSLGSATHLEMETGMIQPQGPRGVEK